MVRMGDMQYSHFPCNMALSPPSVDGIKDPCSSPGGRSQVTGRREREAWESASPRSWASSDGRRYQILDVQ